MDKKEMNKSFNRVHEIMVNMRKEKDEIRRLLNEIDSVLQQHDFGEEELRIAREYYIKAMTKFEGSHK